MQVGWRGTRRAIALSVAATSAFWVALGAWLFHLHIGADHGGSDRAVLTEPSAQSTRRGGFLGGFNASQRGELSTREPAPKSAGPSGLTIPVAGVRAQALTDTFSQARASGARHHDAIDIMAPEGAPVVAAAPGHVEKLFTSDEGGLTLYVRSADRRQIFYYAHLSGYAPGLREGQAVKPGQRLGTVGHTGNADPKAPHLHFAVWNADPRQGWHQQAQAINPYPLLSGGAAR
jgi:murein DD-endopeptidase MepM/ murein hydrolase activator NlpD